MVASADPSFDNPGGGGGGYTGAPTTGQSWDIDTTANTITFAIAPATGVNNIVLREYAADSNKGSARFAIGSWCPEYGYPREVEFFSDRLWFANTPADPQMIWGSEVGNYTSHGRSSPINDSDAVSFAINARQVNAITDLLPLDKLILLAKGGEFLMSGGQDNVITPSTINVRPQSYRGSSGLQAKVVGDTGVFVQEQGQHVFDIGYKLEADGYRPVDISLWAEHLVEGRTLMRMEWAQAPWNLLWFVRDTGDMIACTYLPEQEVIGWHRHDTGRSRAGFGYDEIEDVVVLPGKQQSQVFVLVKRLIDGVFKRYIEQLAPASVTNHRDNVYLDSALTYDGRNTVAVTMTLSTATGWTEDDDLTLTASAAVFSAGDVGNAILIERAVPEVNDAGETSFVGYAARVVIDEYVSATVVKCHSIGNVAEPMQGWSTVNWSRLADVMTGLDHLEGRRVAIFADGAVESNGVTGTAYVVTGGQITLARPCAVVHVGLPYRMHVETLQLTLPGGEPIRGDRKALNKVGLLVKDARGLKVCGGELREDNTYPVAQREFEDYGTPTQPITGYTEVGVDAEWGENTGRMHILSDEPVPAEVLGLIPKFMVSPTP